MLRSVDLNLVSDVSGQPSGHISKGQVRALKKGWIGFSETSVRNYQSTMSNNPQERISQFCDEIKRSFHVPEYVDISGTFTTQEQICYQQSQFG
jgi:hypothetical protein